MRCSLRMEDWGLRLGKGDDMWKRRNVAAAAAALVSLCFLSFLWWRDEVDGDGT